MNQAVTDVLFVMAVNRRRRPKAWVKVRLDRLHKLLPRVERTSLEAALTMDPRVQMKHVLDDDGTLHPAVQLRYSAYQQMLKHGSASSPMNASA